AELTAVVLQLPLQRLRRVGEAVPRVGMLGRRDGPAEGGVVGGGLATCAGWGRVAGWGGVAQRCPRGRARSVDSGASPRTGPSGSVSKPSPIGPVAAMPSASRPA
ncbi:hypothetical protein ADL03_06945, partial [Nocardia sp. NRRL S-836]